MGQHMADIMKNDAIYFETLNTIKKEISQSRTRAVLAVNSELVCMYWRIGDSINAQTRWGNKYLDSLSCDIRSAYPKIKGFSVRNLKYMLKFAREFDYKKVQQAVAQIPWGHIILLMDKTNNSDERDWYINNIIEHGWSRSVLLHQLSTHLYARQSEPKKVNNFEKILPHAESEMIEQAMKDPYIFDFVTSKRSLAEKELEEEMVKSVSTLLLELGKGFAFVGNQYHIKVGDSDFYIDLLFYNIRLHRYVVVELKSDEFKPEYLGQLGFYVEAIDCELCHEGDKPSIGLLLCKTKNNTVAEYSIKSTSKPIGVSEYRTTGELPDEMQEILPSPNDIANRI